LNNIDQKRSGRYCKYKPKELILLTQTDSHSDTHSQSHIGSECDTDSDCKVWSQL